MKTRISKKEWDRLGGLRNPALYRTEVSGRWHYLARDYAEALERAAISGVSHERRPESEQ